MNNFASNGQGSNLARVDRSIWLFMTHRTGSNLVSSILYNNGLGRAKEYFNLENARPIWKLGEEQRRDAALRLMSEGAHNGIFAVKLPFHHFVTMARFLKMNPFSISEQMPEFGTTEFLWIRRRDKLAQAVSLWKAQVTGQWVHRENHDRPDLQVEYDYDRINACYEQICREEFLLMELFSRVDIRVRELVYEDFTRDREALKKVILDLKGDGRDAECAVDINSDHKKIGNEENQRFRERFASDCFGRDL